MRGRHPKPAHMRQRRNKTAASVGLDTSNEKPREGVPDLGPHPKATEEKPEAWHPRTLAWWEDTWASPQAEQYLTVDQHGLYRVAVLMDLFWKTGDPKVSAEIRLAGEKYGQSPLDRVKLRWETGKTDDADRRRGSKKPSATPTPKDDPRRGLSIA